MSADGLLSSIAAAAPAEPQFDVLAPPAQQVDLSAPQDQAGHIIGFDETAALSSVPAQMAALTTINVQSVPYTHDFFAGMPGAAQGWEYYSSNQGRIEVVNGRLRMDDSGDGDLYSLNEAILHLDLRNTTDLLLFLDHTRLSDETTRLPASFTGHYNGDGIALSVDGTHWISVADLWDSFTSSFFDLNGALQEAGLAAGSSDLSDVRIKFQQYGNSPVPNDGREFDNIRVSGAVVVQSVPYAQDFTAELPTGDQGWGYYTTNDGRIQAINGRLRMDRTFPDDFRYCIDEAVLHVNLTSKSNVRLSLDHYNVSDDLNGVSPPSSFTGHTTLDLIALSVDGVHWVTVTALRESFTGQTFALDALLDQAKLDAGSTDVSDVRIMFNRFNVTTGADAVREFDNIRVTAGLAPQIVPYTQDFSAGMPGNPQGWEYYSDHQGRIEVINGRLRMDDSGGGDPYSLNEAILHVNLRDKSDVQLALDHTSLADDNTPLPASFTGHYNGDGIALSTDGIHWVRVADLAGSFTAQTFSLETALAQAKAAAGNAEVSDVRIKFQQYDNYPAPDDGREFDNIQITCEAVGCTPQEVPYVQDFAAGLPAAAQGWEFYSSNQGRIEAVAGGLRMDDFGPGDPYSLNEAILHVDLRDKSVLQLVLDHTSLADDNTSLPASFTGHYNGDGIALSADGIHWIRVASLAESFTNRPFSLDAALELAQAAAGSADVSDVRIKFQQYDNYPGPDDGRVFDNIRLTVGCTPQAIPYVQDFAVGLPGAVQGWEYYSNHGGRILVTGGHLRMDDSVGGDPWSLNEAILHLNLQDKSAIQLVLDHTSLADENTSLPAGFTGHYDGDGIALSVDGIHWIRVASLAESFTSRPFSLDTFLEQAKAAAGSADVSDVRIKFQQYDNYPAPDDGRVFDNIQITAGCTPQAVPCVQSFVDGLPTAGQGWEFYSSDQGRIQITGGRLRMDDFGGGDPYSLNEAILHVDLTGKSSAQLTLDHTSIADDNTPLPANFTGHYNGDGIALSTDGIHWVRVASLTDSFTAQTFGLETALAQAKAAAGNSDVSDVRIKLQQFDNYPAPDDGREFDNVQVTAAIVPQAIPYAQDFNAAMPASPQGWEYYSTGQGRIQVTGGRLRLDDFGPGDPWSLNEAILHVDLNNKANIQLILDHYSLSDDHTPLPAQFEGHYDGDGIALSTDGVHWATVASLTDSFTGRVFSLDAALAQAKTAAGSEDLSNVRIKLQQYDNYPAPDDGREFDNIQIISALVPQTVPYVQDFSAGLPGAIQGWEYYSDNGGRIQVTGGRLRMDDSVGGDPWSLNEAILHLNLQDAGSLLLSLDHTSLSDENTPLPALPATFTGHYNGDGIAVSVDGIHWVTAVSLTDSFTSGFFDLSSALRHAKVEADSDDLSDVRIKFQQYDNYPAPDDGREFDNIQIVHGIEPQAIPYAEGFEAGPPQPLEGWEYRSDNQGRIQVVNGRLRMDDAAEDGQPSLNEAVLHVNLSGKASVWLTLDHYNLSDESTPLPASFKGHVNGDGIALSLDGIRWVSVASLTDSFTSRVFDLDEAIQRAIAFTGDDVLRNVQIRFQQYGDSSAPGGGREFDNIQIVSTLVPQTVPCTQTFSTGLPTVAQGWEFYSSAPGHIEVIDGRLRLGEDNEVAPLQNNTLNRAVLHVDLTGRTGVQLKLDHYNLSDDNNSLWMGGLTFSADGIVLSVDGLHWIGLTDLTQSFTGWVFGLDPFVEQAKTVANSTDVSDVRIMFLQYDSRMDVDAARELDNIQVTAAS